MGQLLGNAVRFDMAQDVMAAGEGIETVLSLRCVMPDMPMVAALSAAHLAAILFPVTLRRLYIVRDNDAAGDGAAARLIDRAKALGIEAITLSPTLEDFNEDLRALGVDALRTAIGRNSRRKTSPASWNCRREPERGNEARRSAGLMAHRIVALPVVSERTASTAFLRGRSGRQTARAGNGFRPTIFRRRQAAFTSRDKIAGLPPSSTSFRPFAALRVQARSARRLSSP